MGIRARWLALGALSYPIGALVGWLLWRRNEARLR